MHVYQYVFQYLCPQHHMYMYATVCVCLFLCIVSVYLSEAPSVTLNIRLSPSKPLLDQKQKPCLFYQANSTLV